MATRRVVLTEAEQAAGWAALSAKALEAARYRQRVENAVQVLIGDGRGVFAARDVATLAGVAVSSSLYRELRRLVDLEFLTSRMLWERGRHRTEVFMYNEQLYTKLTGGGR